MEKALHGVSESTMEAPEGLISISAKDSAGKVRMTEFVYKEHLPAPDDNVPDEDFEKPHENLQPPAPVQDAHPKPVEKR